MPGKAHQSNVEVFFCNFLRINPHNIAQTHAIFQNKGLLHSRFVVALHEIFFFIIKI